MQFTINIIKKKNEASNREGERDINIRESKMASQGGHISAKSWQIRRTQQNLYWASSLGPVPKSSMRLSKPGSPFVLLSLEQPSLTIQLTYNYLQWVSLPLEDYIITLSSKSPTPSDSGLGRSSFSNSEKI